MTKYSLMSNYMYIYKKLVNQNKKFALFVLVTVVVGLIIPLSNVLFPKVMVGILVSNSNRTIASEVVFTNNLQSIIVVILSFFLVTTTARATARYFVRRNNFYLTNLGYKLKEDIQYKSMTMDYQHTEDRNILNKIHIANQCIGKSKNIIEKSTSVISGSIILIVYMYLLLRVNFLFIVILLINAYINSKFLSRTKIYQAGLRSDRAEIDRKKSYLFRTMFDYDYGKEIRLFNMHEILVEKFNKQKNLKKDLNTKVEKKMFISSIIEYLLTFVRESVVYGILIYNYVNKTIEIEDFVLYIGLAASFALIAKGLIEDAMQIVELNPYITDYRMFVEVEREDNQQSKRIKELDTLDRFSLEFKDVYFRYPNAENYVLENLNFKINNGSHVSIVGLNGAGKSSIIKLICRFYEPTKGKIYLNGVDISLYNKESYRKIISGVFQESRLFAFSVLENICLESDNIDEDYFWKALQGVDMHRKITELGNSENTNVLKKLYDDGVEFSGGEIQRLCIARAMYKNGKLLLLDEPTAALDALAEKKIYESISSITKERTTLFISHRLNSNKFCDHIIFLEDGKIVAQGSHEEMLINCKKYKELYQMQAHYYIGEKAKGERKYECV